MNTEQELLRSGATARDAAMATGSRPGLHVGCQRASDDEETLSGGTSGQIELVVECQASAASRGVTLQHAPGLTTFSMTALRQAFDVEPVPADIDSAPASPAPLFPAQMHFQNGLPKSEPECKLPQTNLPKVS